MAILSHKEFMKQLTETVHMTVNVSSNSSNIPVKNKITKEPVKDIIPSPAGSSLF